MKYVLFMRFRHLEYFVAVAEELHFGRAARRMNISQPPLSQSIRSLEENLGVTLFNRTNRKVSLTDEGTYFLEQARDMLRRLKEAEKGVRAVARGEEGRVRVGFVWATASLEFTDRLRTFKQALPRVNLEFLEMSTLRILQFVRSDRLHVGFVRESPEDGLAGLRHCPFGCEGHVLALPRDHPLAAQDKVRMSQLAGEPLIMFPREVLPSHYDEHISCFLEAGFSPTIVQEVRTSRTTRALIAAGLGMSLVPSSTMSDTRQGMVYRPLVGRTPQIKLVMVWRKENETPLLWRFLDWMISG